MLAGLPTGGCLCGEAAPNGDDMLNGGGGDDILTGGPGADSFSGGSGTDVATDLTPSQGDTQDRTIP